MKRFLLIIGAMLLGLMLRAQQVTYTCRYWFDQEFGQASTATFSSTNWQPELDVGDLTEGLHALHLQVMDTSMRWSAPLNYLFLKIAQSPSTALDYHYWFDQDHASMRSEPLGSGHLLLDVIDLEEGLHTLHVMLKGGEEYYTSHNYLFLKTDAWQEGTPNYVYHCWFDEDFANQQSNALGNGHLLLNVAGLEEGMHTVHVLVEGSTYTATQSYLFMKVASIEIDDIDMSHLSYHCWFDEDFEHQQIDSLGDGHLLLEVSHLEDGLHIVHVMLEGGTFTATQSYLFMKMAVEDPSAELQYHCWFDQDYSSVQTGPLGSGLFELEVGDLSNGIHTVNVQLDNGTRTPPLCYLFYKKPLGGYGVARWEYWLNGDVDNRYTTVFSPALDTLDIVSLLPVGHPALRSSCFHFHPNGDAPYINAKNEITFRFWDNENRLFDKSAFYVDEQVEQDIVATVFERNTTETFAAPRNNQITWYKLDAAIGDSLAFKASKACTMQLFAPSGEEVYNASGPESVTLGGLHAWEDGTYYLAVHDVMGSGETVSVTYQYLHKYAVLAYDVHLVGNGGCSTITFQGNGFNNLLDAYLVNAQNDTIRRLDIGHESNTTTTVTFNFYEVNLGVYDAIFQFYDETIRINGALEVQEPVDIVLTSSVSYPSQFLRNRTCTYTYTITNNGNMSAYGVPIYVYISTPTKEGISHLKIEGLDLASFFDAMVLDTLSPNEVAVIREWADEMDDEQRFSVMPILDEETGDSIFVRTNFFFFTLAPFETKTLRLEITADELLDVWLTIPDEVIQPITLGTYRDAHERFCCVVEMVECRVSIRAQQLNWASFWADAALFASLLGGQEFTGVSEVLGILSGLGTIASCVASVDDEYLSFVYDLVCGDYDDGFLDFLRNLSNAMRNKQMSDFGVVMSCIPMAKLFVKGEKVAKGVLNCLRDAWQKQRLDIATDIGALLSSQPECLKKNYMKRPGCPPIPPIGGESEPVNSLDPNDILGYLSESGSHYMRQEIQNVQYEIEFENDTTLATAAAHTIIVRDTLDATKFDLNSLAARSVTIGDKRLELNGEMTFARTLDMRPELYVIAQIEQDYDPTTGVIQWTIQSLDPMTMEPTDDPNQGVLPVNYFGHGVGFIDYSVNLKQAFADGTSISNRAGIIFDQEEVIMTPTWTNIVDAVEPTSYIESVTPMTDSLSFNFVSSDNRSGVWYHTLYYRNASTEQEWQVRKAQIFEDSFVLHLEDLLTTEYLVIAVDSAGNREDKEMVAEYIYTASGIHFVTEGNWSTASNWQEGSLPGADDMVFIDAPCQLDQDAEVAALAINNCHTLTVQSGKTLTVNGLLSNTSAEGLVIEDGAQLVNASANVAATVKKDVQAYNNGDAEGWYTIASPMNGMAVAGSGFVTPEYDLYRYDETNLNGEEWENYKANLADFTTFEKGKGYLFANSNSFSPVFIGMLNNTDVTCSLTCTNRPNDPLSGFNLIGNPFPHNIYKGAGAAIDNANLASGYYTLTNEGTWQAHTFEDAILPGQGILVKATAPTVLTISKSNEEAFAESGDAKNGAKRLSISVSGTSGQDHAYVYFGHGNDLNKVEDFTHATPNLAIHTDKGDFAIAHLDKKSDAVELVFTTPDEGSFTMDVNVAVSDFEYLHLIDSLTGVDVDLLATPSYTFEASPRDGASRFRLLFGIKGN